MARKKGFDRRSLLQGTAGALGLSSLAAAPAQAPPQQQRPRPGTEVEPAGRLKGAKEIIRITKLETMLVKPRWLFLKIHTNAGLVGLGEPVVEGRAKTVACAISEIEPYLVGKDPRSVVHHWQAIYRHAFYRGGPVLTSALSGVDQALWDLAAKSLGVPIYQMLGGPTRNRVRLYSRGDTPDRIREGIKQGYTAFKVGPRGGRPARIVENKRFVDNVASHFASLRQAAGPDIDIGIDFHGAIGPATAKLLIKALEPYQPMFIEEPINCQNHDLMAEIARGTHLPIATGERVFTKWGFREVLEKHAATILQPDLCHAGGITEVRLIAGMAEAYYAAIAPHNPLGPISLAACIQLDASIPNFMCQEFVDLGVGYLKEPFKVVDGYIDVPTGPGLGVELDENALADKITHDWRNPETYHPDDGAVVDW
jgi:galactonate dehydratase